MGGEEKIWESKPLELIWFVLMEGRYGLVCLKFACDLG